MNTYTPGARISFSIIELVAILALLWLVSALAFPSFSWRRRRREAFARAATL